MENRGRLVERSTKERITMKKPKYFIVSGDSLSEYGPEKGYLRKDLLIALEALGTEDIEDNDLVVLEGRVMSVKIALIPEEED